MCKTLLGLRDHHATYPLLSQLAAKLHVGWWQRQITLARARGERKVTHRGVGICIWKYLWTPIPRHDYEYVDALQGELGESVSMCVILYVDEAKDRFAPGVTWK